MNKSGIISEEDLLKPQNMIRLYSRGAFPMADDSGKINWYLPEVRTIIPLMEFNIPRSLKKFMKRTDYEYRFNFNQLEVIKQCAQRESTWISEKLIDAYKNLINFNYLHSVEVYQSNRLIGGLYGIAYKGAFFGESMFSLVSQASKCALVKLIERLTYNNYSVLDVQFQTEHLKMFGAREISFDEFYELLLVAYKSETSF
ncbi:MAG: leucyl/phenylalanyl-tRNA--protein transferase [Ignavibacteria bacterium]|nr:leucyl/phenylalanyl-tRNA--protein transferase [Ignavibacteria bacterium]